MSSTETRPAAISAATAVDAAPQRLADGAPGGLRKAAANSGKSGSVAGSRFPTLYPVSAGRTNWRRQIRSPITSWSPIAWWMRHGGLRHHLRAAAIVGSAVTLLHTSGMLGGLDGLMLKLVGSAGPAWQTTSAPAPMLPLVALVGARLYEQEFRQASPLAPGKLARILASVPAADADRPAALVIDFDLSPGPVEAAADGDRASLDDALRRLLEAGIDVILPTPIRVSTPMLQQRKVVWMQALCAWNDGQQAGRGRLAFGLADIVTNQGAVLQLDASRPSIGVIAARGESHPSLCELAREPSGRWHAPLVGDQFRSDVLLAEAAAHASPLRPFNARFFAGDARQIQPIDALDSPLRPADGSRLASRVLFLGGSFSAQDQFAMPLEGTTRAVEGVVVHAATFYSVRHPVALPSGLLAYALDIGLGVLMGFFFAFCWGWHLRVGERYHPRAGLLAQWAPRVSLLINFIMAGAVATLSVLLAVVFFFPLNLWINPAPIILGVFAKFVLASRGESSAGANADGHNHAAAGRPWTQRLDDLLTMLLVVAALAAIVFGHH